MRIGEALIRRLVLLSRKCGVFLFRRGNHPMHHILLLEYFYLCVVLPPIPCLVWRNGKKPMS